MQRLPAFLFIWSFLPAGGLFAQEQSGWTPGVYMSQALDSCFEAGQVFLDDTNYGYDADGISLVATYMQPGEVYGLTKYLEQQSYVIIAAGDADATNVNLRIVDAVDESTVARDDELDRIAIVEFTPKYAGDFAIEIELAEADVASFVSFIIMRDGGWTIPRTDLNLARGTIMSRCEAYDDILDSDPNSDRYLKFNDGPGQACLFGGLISGGGAVSVTNLILGDGDAKLIGEGDRDVEDIDLRLYDEDFIEVNADRLPDAHPVIDHYTLSSERYHVELSNEAPNDSTPTFCIVAILQARP